MLSTELSTALEIRSRQLFRDDVRAARPWSETTRKGRYAAFRRVWQGSVWQAAFELELEALLAHLVQVV
jgi:hypothetical protein